MENSVATTKKQLAYLKNSSRIKSFRILLRQVSPNCCTAVNQGGKTAHAYFLYDLSFTSRCWCCFSGEGEGNTNRFVAKMESPFFLY